MKYKKVIGGTEKDAEEKFVWLKDARFSSATIDIRDDYLIWKDGNWEDGVWESGVWESGCWEDGIWKGGVWKGGVWLGGIWEDGVWENGGWEDGIWKGGVWKGGNMWNNITQKFEKIDSWDTNKNTFVKRSDLL